MKTSSNMIRLFNPILLFVFITFISQCEETRSLNVDPQSTPQKISLSTSKIQLRDIENRVVTLSSLSDGKKPVVLLFVATPCPVTLGYWERLNILWKNHQSKVQFALIGGNTDDSIESLHQFAQDRELEIPVYWDSGHALASALKVEYTPLAVILNSKGIMLYGGRIDDSWRNSETVLHRWLDDAIRASLQNRFTPFHFQETFMGSHLR